MPMPFATISKHSPQNCNASASVEKSEVADTSTKVATNRGGTIEANASEHTTVCNF